MCSFIRCRFVAQIIQVYDGVRRRALPALIGALKVGTDDDRMKGALWTINSPSFGKYAISGEQTYSFGPFAF